MVLDRREGAYPCVEVYLPDPETADLASGVLWDHEPLGVVEEPDPAGVCLRSFYSPDRDPAEVVADLETIPGARVVVSELAPGDWFEKFREGFRVFSPIPGVTIRPPWVDPPGEGLDLVIEPGAAFGTGLHESTRIAMTLIEELPVSGSRLLDVGAGSGVLAFFAAARGARSVALEVDLQATGNLRRNRRLNGLQGRLPIVCGGPSCLRGGTFPLIVANLTLEILQAESPELMRLAGPGGQIVLSGILVKRQRAARKLAESMGEVQREAVMGDWMGLLVRTEG